MRKKKARVCSARNLCLKACQQKNQSLSTKIFRVRKCVSSDRWPKPSKQSSWASRLAATGGDSNGRRHPWKSSQKLGDLTSWWAIASHASFRPTMQVYHREQLFFRPNQEEDDAITHAGFADHDDYDTDTGFAFPGGRRCAAIHSAHG